MTIFHEPELKPDRWSPRRVVFASPRCPGSWFGFTTTAAACILLLQGCTQTEIRGTYDVEIEFVGVTDPIEGTLIFSARSLDVPSLSEEERNSAGDWFESDTINANSCFVLHTGSDAEQTPQNVRVFDARIRGSELTLPIEIYRTPVQHIEIVRLQFFANTMGGEVVFHDRGQQRPGRIHGVRSGSPTPQRCLDDLGAFRANLTRSLAQ